MGDWIILLILVFVIGLFIYMRYGKISGVQNLNAEQFAEEMKRESDYLLIDVREAHEFKGGHIRGAKNIPLSQISEHLATISPNKKLYIYCQSGVRSRQAASVLSKYGFAHITNLQGGIMSWHGEKVK